MVFVLPIGFMKTDEGLQRGSIIASSLCFVAFRCDTLRELINPVMQHMILESAIC